MSIPRKLPFCVVAAAVAWLVTVERAEAAETNTYYRKLTLAPERVDTVDPMGPLFYRRTTDTTRVWALPPLFSFTVDEDTDWAETDFLYPVSGYDGFGSEYKYHIFQVFNFYGGKT